LTSDPLVSLGLEADINALPVQNWNVVVSGTPSPNAGTAQRSISIPVTVLDSYDAQIVGIEVTQGIQAYDLPGYDSGNAQFNIPVRARAGITESGWWPWFDGVVPFRMEGVAV
jgi:hypothetical protein